jgi:hypothetical protein
MALSAARHACSGCGGGSRAPRRGGAGAPRATAQPRARRAHLPLPPRPTAARAGPDAAGGGDELTAVFAAEVARRAAAEAAAAEAAAAEAFDGSALLALVKAKYGRSYDFSLVQRQYMGKTFVALNV